MWPVIVFVCFFKLRVREFKVWDFRVEGCWVQGFGFWGVLVTSGGGFRGFTGFGF